ncbi:Chaperone protein dnaJ 11, chloroplastic [Glycine soja]
MISFVSFPMSLPAINFSGNAMASSSCCVKSRPIGILGIPVSASNQEIKAAYRRLAKVCHPDMAAIDRKNSSADEFMKIHTAYSTFSDPDKRANYDQNLFWQQRF